MITSGRVQSLLSPWLLNTTEFCLELSPREVASSLLEGSDATAGFLGSLRTEEKPLLVFSLGNTSAALEAEKVYGKKTGREKTGLEVCHVCHTNDKLNSLKTLLQSLNPKLNLITPRENDNFSNRSRISSKF